MWGMQRLGAMRCIGCCATETKGLSVCEGDAQRRTRKRCRRRGGRADPGVAAPCATPQASSTCCAHRARERARTPSRDGSRARARAPAKHRYAAEALGWAAGSRPGQASLGTRTAQIWEGIAWVHDAARCDSSGGAGQSGRRCNPPSTPMLAGNSRSPLITGLAAAEAGRCRAARVPEPQPAQHHRAFYRVRTPAVGAFPVHP